MDTLTLAVLRVDVSVVVPVTPAGCTCKHGAPNPAPHDASRRDVKVTVHR